MRKLWGVVLMVLLASAAAFCAEDKSVWKDGKLYEGAAYDALEAGIKEQVKGVVEEYAMALLMKDTEDLDERTYYDGFPSEKKAKIAALINAYHNKEGFTCTNIEVITVKLKNDMKDASVGVKVYFSTVDTKGGLSTAPVSIQAWKFTNRYDEWYYLFEK
ncbi:MAG: hypothetical protein PHS64_02940 [Candidatus Omnitrophica bacterium]|nr:hypothetical protein [Candidatus Omnitrophota bacterium]MDD5774880.1 hypothetical protein [Candidatus Omnitrophota bacterium]